MNRYLLVIILIVFSAVTIAESKSSVARQKEEAEQELKLLKNKIHKLQSRLNKKRKQQSSALKKLQQTEKKISVSSKLLRKMRKQLVSKEKELSRLQRQQKIFENQKQAQKKVLAEQLRSAYINGKQEYLKLLLNQQDPDKLGRMLVYYDYMNKARTQQVIALKETLSELQTIDSSIKVEIDNLGTLKESKEKEAVALKKLKQKRQKLVKKLEKEIKSGSNKLSQLEINANALQQLIDSVRETIEAMDFNQRLEGLAGLKRKLIRPIKGRLLRRFGAFHQGRRSSGQLIAGREGEQVKAIYHGRVVYADWLRGFGLLIIVDHGKGYMSLYSYNQALYNEVGDWVEPGEAIATVGQSGGQKRPALYFELRRNGKPINPRRWFR